MLQVFGLTNKDKIQVLKQNKKSNDEDDNNE
jgi:hypothetical protein